MLRRAGCALLGGHTVSDPEIKFGYSVTGEVDPDRVLTNAGARSGDVLFLTKPLGTGIIVRARKYGKGDDGLLEAAVHSMTQLNDVVVALSSELPGAIHACTDVTGFGLAGHATEMAAASGTTLVLDAEALPVLPGALDLAKEFLPCGGRANARHFQSIEVADGVAPERHLICLDPQTSGGLLLAVDPGAAGDVSARLDAAGRSAWRIGRVTAGNGRARVRLA
jgi:selenide,water dikinase